MSLGISQFEAVYGRECRTPVNWENLVKRVVIGLEMLKGMERELIRIRKKLKADQDRKKSYADMKIVHREFKVRDHVYLRVNPRKSSLKLRECAKLALRYCGPFEILDRIRNVSYRIELPTHMNEHNVFSHFTAQEICT